LDICGPIIEILGDTVVFVHFTAKGYVPRRMLTNN
jgi:hypothetical protein